MSTRRWRKWPWLENPMKNGELVTAVVVPKPGEQLQEEEIIEFCKGKLAGYKRPRLVKFMSSLPRNSTGKIKKDELREMIKRGKL